MVERRLAEVRYAYVRTAPRRDPLAAGRRRRRRLVVVAAFAAALVVSAILAGAAFAMPGPYARASLDDVGGTMAGLSVVTAAQRDNSTVVRAKSDDPVAAWSHGATAASSFVGGGSLVSIAVVKLADVELLGRIHADQIMLRVTAGATAEQVEPDPGDGLVDGLTVDGQAVDLSTLPLHIAGLGTLTALAETSVQQDGALETKMTGLALQLDGPLGGLSAGDEIVAGEVAAAADEQTAARLVPSSPTPPATTGASPAAKASDAAKPKAGHTARGGTGSASASGGASAATGSSGGSASGGSTSTSGLGSGYRVGTMPPPGPVSGHLVSFPGAVFPVKGKYYFSDDWHVPSRFGGLHSGIDIFAARNTPLVAVQDGTIQELRWRSLGGRSLHMVNDRGDYFYYAHLQAYAAGIHNGVRVTAGQVIGYVGNSGDARYTHTHCHFEVHPGGGGAVNPYPYLQLWRGATAAGGPDATRAGHEAQAHDVRAPLRIPKEGPVVAAGMLRLPQSGGTAGTGELMAVVPLSCAGLLATMLLRRQGPMPHGAPLAMPAPVTFPHQPRRP